MKKRYYILFGFLILIGLWVGYGFIRCAQEADIIELEFDRSNPTEYVFPVSVSVIRDSLSRPFRYFIDDSLAVINFKGGGFREDSLNHYHIYDFAPNDSYIFRYRKTKIGVHQNVLLAIVLDSLSPSGTKIKVKPIFNEVLIGVKFWSNPWFTEYYYKGKEIPSTTIEEYELLRYIGKRLGYMDKMPLVKYPKQLTREQIFPPLNKKDVMQVKCRLPFTYEEMFGEPKK